MLVLLVYLSMFMVSSMSFGNQEVLVNFCCGEGEAVVVRDSSIITCGNTTETMEASPAQTFMPTTGLEGRADWTGEQVGNLGMAEVRRPRCSRGLSETIVLVNETEFRVDR